MMARSDGRRGHDDDATRLLRDTVQLLTDQIQLQSELMKLQNAQLLECRQQLERQAGEPRQARQELALRHRLLGTSARFWRLAAPHETRERVSTVISAVAPSASRS